MRHLLNANVPPVGSSVDMTLGTIAGKGRRSALSGGWSAASHMWTVNRYYASWLLDSPSLAPFTIGVLAAPWSTIGEKSMY